MVVILGFPDEIFFLLVYCGIATIMAVIFGVLFLLVPSIGKIYLKAKLFKKSVLLEHGKASSRAVLADNFGPGWIKTSEGKKLMAPIPPKNKGEWNPERDILGKITDIDGIKTLHAYEAQVLTANPEMLYTFEAYCKGYKEETKIPIGNPGPEILVPTSPKSLVEAVGRLNPEEFRRFAILTLEEEEKRRMKSEWGPIIKIALILGMIFIAGLIVLLIAKGALGV